MWTTMLCAIQMELQLTSLRTKPKVSCMILFPIMASKNKQYTKVTTHVDAKGKEFKSVAGTQSLDGWWTHAKRATHGVNARYAGQVEAHVHTEQWQHWEGNADRWYAAGHVLNWIPN